MEGIRLVLEAWAPDGDGTVPETFPATKALEHSPLRDRVREALIRDLRKSRRSTLVTLARSSVLNAVRQIDAAIEDPGDREPDDAKKVYRTISELLGPSKRPPVLLDESERKGPER